MSKNELHPSFPSGEWKGFYNYSPGSEKHNMKFYLNFKDGIVMGAGNDDVAPFSWSGTYDTKTMKCDLIKTYPTHQVIYNGEVDENGIWGMWDLKGWRGGFHIWPKGMQDVNTMEEKEINVVINEK